VASFRQGNIGPEKLRQPVAPVRSLPLDRQIDQEGQMLLGANPDRFAGRSEQGRLPETTEVRAFVHATLGGVFSESMRR
jgi:hypothetical protein